MVHHYLQLIMSSSYFGSSALGSICRESAKKLLPVGGQSCQNPTVPNICSPVYLSCYYDEVADCLQSSYYLIKTLPGDSLAVQWMGLMLPLQGAHPIHGQGTKVPCTAQPKEKQN